MQLKHDSHSLDDSKLLVMAREMERMEVLVKKWKSHLKHETEHIYCIKRIVQHFGKYANLLPAEQIDEKIDSYICW